MLSSLSLHHSHPNRSCSHLYLHFILIQSKVVFIFISTSISPNQKPSSSLSLHLSSSIRSCPYLYLYTFILQSEIVHNFIYTPLSSNQKLSTSLSLHLYPPIRSCFFSISLQHFIQLVVFISTNFHPIKSLLQLYPPKKFHLIIIKLNFLRHFCTNHFHQSKLYIPCRLLWTNKTTSIFQNIQANQKQILLRFFSPNKIPVNTENLSKQDRMLHHEQKRKN